jgi:hypothetical protein
VEPLDGSTGDGKADDANEERLASQQVDATGAEFPATNLGQSISLPAQPPIPESSLNNAPREMNEFERSTIRWARVAVVLSALAAVFVCLQWWEMHTGGVDTKALAKAAGEQSIAAGKQADEATAQVAKMTESLGKTDKLIEATNKLAVQAARSNKLTEESIRGRIVMKSIRLRSPVTAGEPVLIQVETENVGHSAAIERDVRSSRRWKRIPEGAMPIKIPPLTEANTIEPGSQGSLFFAGEDQPMTQSFINGLGKPGAETIYFFGRIVYETLGREHYTEFCTYLIPFNSSLVPDVKATAGMKADSHYTLMQCPKWHGSN